jgi:ATP-binding cassette subfamily B protein
MARRLRNEWHALKEFESSALKVLQEVLSALRVVKAFGKEDVEKERLVDVATQGMRAHVQVVATKARFDGFVGLIGAAGTAAVLITGVMQVQSGALTLGELLLVLAYLTHLYGPIEVVVGQMGNLQSSLASAERALALLDTVSEVIERPNARAIGRAAGSIEFRRVSFTYGNGHPVLDRVSFLAPAGTRVGLIGPTGAGKTTLVNLMTRLYDPADGGILLDGVDLRDYRLADLRNQFAIVIQEPVLFSKTIEENIAYARPGATRDEIVAAAQQAHAHEFIMGLPDGYGTRVGERGMRLSGGERQRVSLARAFLKDAPILILDEPTSSVDMKTEALIMAALERLMHGRTTFIIAHRPSTLRTCDIVLVLEDGRLRTVDAPASDSAIEALVLGAPAVRPERAVDPVAGGRA